MAEITRETVEKVATLARLRLSSEDVAHYQTQLSRVIGYFDELAKVDVALAGAWRGDTLAESTVERDDEVRAFGQPEELLASAPQRAGSAFQVPRIIE